MRRDIHITLYTRVNAAGWTDVICLLDGRQIFVKSYASEARANKAIRSGWVLESNLKGTLGKLAAQ